MAKFDKIAVLNKIGSTGMVQPRAASNLLHYIIFQNKNIAMHIYSHMHCYIIK